MNQASLETTNIEWLQAWYMSQCNDEWEHQYGVVLTTFDNPGWDLQVDLEHTYLEGRPFERVKIERDEHDWVHASIEGKRFVAACGPLNINEAIFHFRRWAQSPPTAAPPVG
jgi:hypothetical protein